MSNKLKLIYDALTENADEDNVISLGGDPFRLPSYGEFKGFMKDPSRQEKFFDKVSPYYRIGESFEEFSKLIAPDNISIPSGGSLSTQEQDVKPWLRKYTNFELERKQELAKEVQEDGVFWSAVKNTLYRGADTFTYGLAKRVFDKPALTELFETHFAETPYFKDNTKMQVARTLMGMGEASSHALAFLAPTKVMQLTKLPAAAKSATVFASVGGARRVLDPEVAEGMTFDRWMVGTALDGMLGAAFPFLGRLGGEVVIVKETARALGNFFLQAGAITTAAEANRFADTYYNAMKDNPNKRAMDVLQTVGSDYIKHPEQIIKNLATMTFLHGTSTGTRFMKGGKLTAEEYHKTTDNLNNAFGQLEKIGFKIPRNEAEAQEFIKTWNKIAITKEGEQIEIFPYDAKKAGSVDAVMEKQRLDIAESNKTTPQKIKGTLRKKIWDISGEAKEILMKDGGIAGKEAVMNLELSAGASAKAERMYSKAEKEIFGELSHKEIDVLSDFIQGKRTVEIDEIYDIRGEKRPKHPGDKGKEHWAEWFKKFDEEVPLETRTRIEAASERYFGEMRKQLDMLKENGLLTDEAYAELVEQQHYSPRRFIQHLDPLIVMPSGGKIISVPDSGIRALQEGSTQSLMNNPKLLISQTILRTQGRIMRNEANKSLYRTVQENPEIGAIEMWDGKGKVPAGKTSVSVMLDGKRHFMLLENNFARSWLIRDPEISMSSAKILRWITGSAILRPFATGGLNPEFAIANIPRDLGLIWMSTARSKGGYSTFGPKAAVQMGVDMAAVARDVVTRTGRYEDYINEGGGLEFLTHQGRVTAQQGEFLTIKPLRDVRDYFEYSGTTSELLTRLMLRERAIKSGKSQREATWIARRYLDFSQGGSAIKVADNAIPYLNASIQATRSILRSAKEDPGTFSAKVAQIGALSTGMYLANRSVNPEAYDQISEEQKNANWIITTPYSYNDKSGRKRYIYISIPKDQGQRVFASGFEALSARLFYGEMPSKQVLKSIEDFVPLIPGNISIPTLDAYHGYVLNKDFWTKEDIWRGPEVIPEEEYTTRTHPAFVSIGDALGISPERMKYALGEIFTRRNIFTGLVGSGLKELLDTIPEEETGQMWEEISKLPFARRILRSTSPFVGGDREKIQRISIEENSRRNAQNRELYQLVDTKAPLENVRTFIASQPTEDRERLKNRYFNSRNVRGLQGWWYDMMDISSPEARAYAFYEKWSDAEGEERKQIEKTSKEIKGFLSDRFKKKFRELRKMGEKSQ